MTPKVGAVPGLLITPDEFLAAHGFGAALRQPFPADASARHYERLVGGPRPALLMYCPPPEDARPFIHLARYLGAEGLSVPEILAADEAAGLALIEDFGEAAQRDLLDAGADPLPLYEEAAETLAALHAVPPLPELPGWGWTEMSKAAAATFLEWWWPAMMGGPASAEVRAEFFGAMRAMLEPFPPSVFTHRDYFPANLMRLPARSGARRTGLIDFQDAALGHPAYDLISLVEDARRPVAPEVREASIARYLACSPGLEEAGLRAAMAAQALQRHIRVAALWVRLARRDGKPDYLRFSSHSWGLLTAALRHKAAAPMAAFFDRHVPVAQRHNPPAMGSMPA